ncbi:MAG: EamA family transporter [Planctomycetaceae bacterium]|nr:EamA family transporter [Planctomycetaceae bacterium]
MTEEERAARSPEGRRVLPWYLDAPLHLALNAALVTVSELLLKKGALVSAGSSAPRWLSRTGLAALGSGWVLAGILCYLLSFANWLYLLRRVPLYIAFPVTNLSHALIPLGAWIFLGERFGYARAAGIVLIVTGTWFIVRPPTPRGAAA